MTVATAAQHNKSTPLSLEHITPGCSGWFIVLHADALSLTRGDFDAGGVICELRGLVDRAVEKENSLGGGFSADHLESKTNCPSLTCCFLSDRKSVTQLQLELGTLKWEC